MMMAISEAVDGGFVIRLCVCQAHAQAHTSDLFANMRYLDSKQAGR